MRSECGARGRNDTLRTRAASGIMQAGITTGRWGAATGLGQVWAGNARNNCVRCCPRKGERHRSAFSPRPRKPGLKPRAAGESPPRQNRGGTPTGELPRKGGGRASCTSGRSKRLPAFRFPFFFPPSSVLRSVIANTSVIAGLDPAIHAEVRLGQTFDGLHKPQLTMDHRHRRPEGRRSANGYARW